MRQIIKRLFHPILKLWLYILYLKPKVFTYENISVLVHKEVFPPHLTFSTTILLEFIKSLNLTNKSVLELGCGCGIISLYSAKMGATVTASDINTVALEYLKRATVENNIDVLILESNLFDNISKEHFDFIFINPPYYAKEPVSIKERAWFCGADFEYFEALFPKLYERLFHNTNCYMILSEDCKIETIKAIALKYKIFFIEVHSVINAIEVNFIFKLERAQ